MLMKLKSMYRCFSHVNPQTSLATGTEAQGNSSVIFGARGLYGSGLRLCVGLFFPGPSHCHPFKLLRGEDPERMAKA